MTTQLNGKEAAWPEAVRARFDEVMSWLPPANITQANYFTPRPYVDEYNRGSHDHGFVYTIDGRHVCYLTLAGPPLI